MVVYYGIVGMRARAVHPGALHQPAGASTGQVVIDGKDLCVMPAKELIQQRLFHQHDLSAVQLARA